MEDPLLSLFKTEVVVVGVEVQASIRLSVKKEEVVGEVVVEEDSSITHQYFVESGMVEEVEGEVVVGVVHSPTPQHFDSRMGGRWRRRWR